MELKTAKEIVKVANKKHYSHVISKVMREITIAAENGQYTTTVKVSYLSEEERGAINTTFKDLGYKVITKAFKYTGTPKIYYLIEISWKND